MKIGSITYATGNVQHHVLNVVRKPQFEHGLGVELVPCLPYEIKSHIGALDEIVNRSIRGIYDNFSDVFGEDEVRKILSEMILERTFFEDEEAYGRHDDPVEEDGIYRPKRKVQQNGDILKPGSYIQIHAGDFKTELTLMHEWGHELHYRSCSYGIASHPYEKYDTVMDEVAAITVEKLVGEDLHFGYPHNTADDLVIRLFEVSKLLEEEERIKTTIKDQWMFLLKFKNYKIFDHLLSLLEKTYSKGRFV